MYLFVQVRADPRGTPAMGHREASCLNLKGVSARMKIVFKDINSLQRYSKILKAGQHTQQLVTFKPRVPLIHNDTWSLLIDLEELDK